MPKWRGTSIKNYILTLPNLSLAEALQKIEQFDMLFIPGGFDITLILSNPALLQQIGQLTDRAPHVSTVCTESVLLAFAGRLDGHKATTNKHAYDDMTPMCMYSDLP